MLLFAQGLLTLCGIMTAGLQCAGEDTCAIEGGLLCHRNGPPTLSIGDTCVSVGCAQTEGWSELSLFLRVIVGNFD